MTVQIHLSTGFFLCRFSAKTLIHTHTPETKKTARKKIRHKITHLYAKSLTQQEPLCFACDAILFWIAHFLLLLLLLLLLLCLFLARIVLIDAVFGFVYSTGASFWFHCCCYFDEIDRFINEHFSSLFFFLLLYMQQSVIQINCKCVRSSLKKTKQKTN